MFDLGFIKDIRFLFRRMPMPKARLNMLFSATLSYRVKELAFEHMNNPESVVVEPEQKTGHRIQEELFYPSNLDKMRLLQTLIEEEWPDRAIIFANTKHRCEDLWAHLAADKHRVGLLTGDVPQKKNVFVFWSSLPRAKLISWLQPMLPPEAFISLRLPMYSTTISLTMQKTMSTVLAVLAVPVKVVTRSALPVSNMQSI